MAEKVSMSEFEKRLSEGRYDSLTGARRGIGKMAGWSEAERALANRKADAHFGSAPKKGAPKKGKAPKKAATKSAKAPKMAAPKVVRRGRAKVAAAPAPSAQLNLPLVEEEISRARASKEKSEAMQRILENAARTKDLGGPDADIRKIAAAASKDLIDSIHALLGTTESVRHGKDVGGDNGSKTTDTSTADAALTAAANAAKAATTKSPPIIPPLMGRQG